MRALTGGGARMASWAVLAYALGTLLAWLVAPWILAPTLLPLTRPLSALLLAAVAGALLLARGAVVGPWPRAIVVTVLIVAVGSVVADQLGPSIGGWGGPWAPYLGDRSPWPSVWTALPVALLCLALLLGPRHVRTGGVLVLLAIAVAYGFVLTWVAGAHIPVPSGSRTFPLTQVAIITLAVAATRGGALARPVTGEVPDPRTSRRWDVLLLGSAVIPMFVVALLTLALRMPAMSVTVGNAIVGFVLAAALLTTTWRAILAERTLRMAERDALEEAEQLALHDPLTSLANRTLAMEALSLAMARSRRSGRPVTVLFCDLDGLKRVNDVFGHSAGDRLITAVAERLLHAVRDEDVVARLGGDEFLVITERLDTAVERMAFAERVLASVSAPVGLDGTALHPGISVGVAVAGDDEHPIEVIRHADAAMYKAKANGRGRWEVYDPSMRTEMEQRRRLESEMRIALMGQEIEVHLQPVVRLADHRVVAAEALARWRHPTHGLMDARSWLAVAEESAHLIAIGRFVIVSACRWLSTEGTDLEYLSINLSPRELAQEDLPGFCTAQAHRAGLAPGRLAFEVSDETLGAGGTTAIAQVRALAEGGFRVLVDCFGTGRDSLSTWLDLPVTGLKLDPSIAGALHTEHSDHDARAQRAARLAAAGAGLAAGLHIMGIACGIEHPEQEAELHRLGWEFGQGFLFARPQALHLQAS